MKLSYKKTFFLHPKPPFHFDGTFHKPSHFPNKLKMNEWEPGRYWQTFRVGKELFVLQAENKGTRARPKIKITLYSSQPLSKKEAEKIKKEINWRFELETDLSEFVKLAKGDKKFYPVFKKWLGMRAAAPNTLYELLIIAIVLQNATVRRSQQMLDALLKKFGTRVVFGNKELWAIWLPEKLKNVSEEELRDLKIGYRAKFIKRLTQDFIDGKINEKHLRDLNKEECKRELMKLYGVGPETARILLFEAFHHYDTFEHIAPWQQKIYSRLFYGKKLVRKDKIRRDILDQYSRYSMLAVHYIWEDIWWRRKNEHIPWLEKEIRL